MPARLHRAALQRFLDGPAQHRLRGIAEEIRAVAEAEAPKATGDLAQSGRVSRAKGSGLFGTGIRGTGVEIEFTSPHALPVHQGTGPGHIPSPRARYFPPLSKRRGGLVHWSEDRGLSPLAVARGIYAKGTPANPFLARAIHRVLDPLNLRIISEKDV